MALLLSAFPGQFVSNLETALQQTATDLGTTGPDNTYGNGMVNVLNAYQFLDRTNINVFVDGRWFLDLNRNGIWDGTPIDAISYFGSGWPTPYLSWEIGPATARKRSVRSITGHGRWI